MANNKRLKRAGHVVPLRDYDADEEAGGVAVMEEKDIGSQLSELLNVLRAVKKGDFTARLHIGNGSIMGKISDALNDVISMNESFYTDIGRISNIVGGEGKLTERFSIGMVTGSWGTMVESINMLIDNLAQPTTEVGRVITAVAEGDLTRKMMLEIDGKALKGEFLIIEPFSPLLLNHSV
ncbi:MAG: hypothetical protein HZA06_02650 [Nitrospirae bacterium]|nr:hypothetical protein [Nitrospirota bacterium]